MLSKDQWLIEYERIPEDWDNGTADEDECRARLRALGFDAHEIEDHMEALTCVPFGNKRGEPPHV